MDTFTTIVGIVTLSLIYFGERFNAGAYLLIASIFAILLAWRMGEEIFYIGISGLIFVLIYRTFFAHEDVRDSQGDN